MWGKVSGPCTPWTGRPTGFTRCQVCADHETARHPEGFPQRLRRAEKGQTHSQPPLFTRQDFLIAFSGCFDCCGKISHVEVQYGAPSSDALAGPTPVAMYAHVALFSTYPGQYIHTVSNYPIIFQSLIYEYPHFNLK